MIHAAAKSPEAGRNHFLASALFTPLNVLMLFAVNDVPGSASKTETVLQS